MENKQGIAGEALEQMARSNFGIIIANAQQLITHVNTAFTRITGYEIEDAIGRKPNFLQGKETNHLAVQTISQGLAQDRTVRVGLLNYRKDGTSFWNFLTIAPMFDSSGKVTQYVGVQVVQQNLFVDSPTDLFPWTEMDTVQVNSSGSNRQNTRHIASNSSKNSEIEPSSTDDLIDSSREYRRKYLILKHQMKEQKQQMERKYLHVLQREQKLLELERRLQAEHHMLNSNLASNHFEQQSVQALESQAQSPGLTSSSASILCSSPTSKSQSECSCGCSSVQNCEYNAQKDEPDSGTDIQSQVDNMATEAQSASFIFDVKTAEAAEAVMAFAAEGLHDTKRADPLNQSEHSQHPVLFMDLSPGAKPKEHSDTSPLDDNILPPPADPGDLAHIQSFGTIKISPRPTTKRLVNSISTPQNPDDTGYNSDSSLSDSPPSLLDHSRLSFVSETRLPMDKGIYRVQVYKDRIKNAKESEIVVIIADHTPVEGQSGVITRVHDQCFTSEVLGSLKCDCRIQLDYALQFVKEHKQGGMVIYMPQEGRGIGLGNKIKAYYMQEHGFDTVDANRVLGFVDDCRDYSVVPLILAQLRIRSIKLMTNNPRKVRVLTDCGVKIVSRLPCVVALNKYSQGYLASKQARMGHVLENHG